MFGKNNFAQMIFKRQFCFWILSVHDIACKPMWNFAENYNLGECVHPFLLFCNALVNFHDILISSTFSTLKPVKIVWKPHSQLKNKEEDKVLVTVTILCNSIIKKCAHFLEQGQGSNSLQVLAQKVNKLLAHLI